MIRTAILVAIALAGCAGPQRRADKPGVECSSTGCGVNGPRVTGLRGDGARPTMQIVALPRPSR